MVDLKSEAQLKAMDYQQLQQRLRDVSWTLAAMRKGKKRGMGNPEVYHQIKLEKKLIQKIQDEKGWRH